MFGRFVGFACAAEVMLARVGNLGEFGRPLLKLKEVVVSCLDALVSFCILTLFESVQVAEAINLHLVSRTLFLDLL